MAKRCASEHCGKVLKRAYAYQCCKNCLNKAKAKETARQKKQEQAFENFMRACKPLDVDYASLRRDFAKNPELVEKWATITRIFRVALDSSLESAIETAQYLRQALPCVEVISTDFDHVPDAQAARTLGTQEWYQYDGDTLSTSAAAILGSSKSEAKRTAARENGKKGGRPKTFRTYVKEVAAAYKAEFPGQPLDAEWSETAWTDAPSHLRDKHTWREFHDAVGDSL